MLAPPKASRSFAANRPPPSTLTSYGSQLHQEIHVKATAHGWQVGTALLQNGRTPRRCASIIG